MYYLSLVFHWCEKIHHKFYETLLCANVVQNIHVHKIIKKKYKEEYKEELGKEEKNNSNYISLFKDSKKN